MILTSKAPGLYLEHARVRGEKDVGEEGLSGDGEVVQPPPAQPGHCPPPGDKVAGLPGAREIRRDLSLLRVHAVRLQRKPRGRVFV